MPVAESLSGLGSEIEVVREQVNCSPNRLCSSWPQRKRMQPYARWSCIAMRSMSH